MPKGNQAKFKSQPFIKLNYIQNRKQKTLPKMLNLMVIGLILISAFFVLIGLGYQPPYANVNAPDVPGWIQAVRGVSIFCLLWWLVCSLWLMKLGFEMYNQTQKRRWQIFSWSLIPYLNLIGISYIFQNMRWSDYSIWFLNLFETDAELKIWYSRKSWRYILFIFIAIIISPEIVFAWLPHYDPEFYPVYGRNLDNVWFYGMQYFTIQTNLLCVLFAWTFVLFPHWKIFKSHTWLIWCITYLMIVGITYDAFLLPNDFRSKVSNWSQYKWTKTMWEHVVNPIIFCGGGIILLSQTKSIKSRDWLTTLKFGMIIPSIYLFYVFIAPFMSFQTVYSWLTNANPNVPNMPGGLTPHGEWYMIFLMAGYWFVFIGVMTGIWYIDITSYYKYLKKYEPESLKALKNKE